MLSRLLVLRSSVTSMPSLFLFYHISLRRCGMMWEKPWSVSRGPDDPFWAFLITSVVRRSHSPPPSPKKLSFFKLGGCKKIWEAFIQKSLFTLRFLYKFEKSWALTLLDELSIAGFFANLGTSNLRFLFMNLLLDNCCKNYLDEFLCCT